MKKFGFTLAEILITLGIIGVIAAIVMPALFSNIEKATLEKQTLKFYNILTTAFSNYKADNESPTITNIGFNSDNFVRDYFKAERCSTIADCFSDTYSLINPSQNNLSINFTSIFSDGAYTAYKLSDGTVFLIEGYDEEESHPLTIYFDVNGQKGPNKAGRDYWAVKAYYDGSIDEAFAFPEYKKGTQEQINSINSSIESSLQNCLKDNNYGAGCFGHFMRNGFKFDY